MFGFPEGKRYNTSAGRYRRIYGERLQKLVIDAGFSCPNRDGTLGTGGSRYSPVFHRSRRSGQSDQNLEFRQEVLGKCSVI